MRDEGDENVKKRKLLFTIISIIVILVGVSIVMICKFGTKKDGTKKDENPLIPVSAPFVKAEIYSNDLYVAGLVPRKDNGVTDRKSTRLNSSHA